MTEYRGLLIAASESEDPDVCRSCLCDSGYCFVRKFLAEGTGTADDPLFDWAATGEQVRASEGYDIAVDPDGNSYSAAGSILALDSDGVVLWRGFSKNGRHLEWVDVDDDYVWALSQYTPGGLFSLPVAAQVWRFDKTTGELLDHSASELGFQRVTSLRASQDGYVWVGTATGLRKVTVAGVGESAVYTVTSVGCSASISEIAVDPSFNVYVAGAGCVIPETDTNCEVSANVRMYTAAGAFVRGESRFGSATDIVYHDGKIYIGGRAAVEVGTGGETYCNIQRWDATTFACDWEVRLATELDVQATIRDMAVSDDGLYVAANGYITLLDLADGSFIWSRKWEGTDVDTLEVVSGRVNGVAARTGYVVAVGQGIPCNSTAVDAMDIGVCSECSCACCECGGIGKLGEDTTHPDWQGGILVDCGCDQVPCEFDAPISIECSDTGDPLLEDDELHWSYAGRNEDGDHYWIGTIDWNCADLNQTFIATYVCGAGWDVKSYLNYTWTDGESLSGESLEIPITIDEQWCTDGAPEWGPFPGFRFSATLTQEFFEAQPHPPNISDCCDGDIVICGGGPCEEECPCDPAPAKVVTASISDNTCAGQCMNFGGGSGNPLLSNMDCTWTSQNTMTGCGITARWRLTWVGGTGTDQDWLLELVNESGGGTIAAYTFHGTFLCGTSDTNVFTYLSDNGDTNCNWSTPATMTVTTAA